MMGASKHGFDRLGEECLMWGFILLFLKWL